MTVSNIYTGLKDLHTHWSRSKQISENENLNDYTEPGMYYCPGNAIATTLSNCPVSSAFALLVEKNNAYDSGVKQTLTVYNNAVTYMRTFYYNNDTLYTSGWGSIYEETGWINITFPSGFAHYSDGRKAQYRRIGKEVFMRGAIKNTSAFTPSSDTSSVIGTIGNATCRPSEAIERVEQGSLMNRFALKIATDGKLYINRYGTTSSGQVPANAWLNIECSFLVE
jgi:hypothetical protein